VIDLNPGSAQGYYGHGAAWLADGDMDRAILNFEI
jgi:hypothetical protein